MTLKREAKWDGSRDMEFARSDLRSRGIGFCLYSCWDSIWIRGMKWNDTVQPPSQPLIREHERILSTVD